MRLAAITPIRVTDEELRRRQQRYDRLAPAPLRVTLHNLDDPAGDGGGGGVPRALDTAADIRRSETLVAAAIGRLAPGSFDAALPDCVLDPAVGQEGPQEAAAPVPVFGMLRLAAGFLTGMGARFGAVTRNRVIGEELAAKLHGYQLDQGFSRVAVLEVGFDAIAEGSAWGGALDGAVATLAADGVTTVINGCSAVDLDPAAGGDVEVVDPTALALRLLAAWAATRQPAAAAAAGGGR